MAQADRRIRDDMLALPGMTQPNLDPRKARRPMVGIVNPAPGMTLPPGIRKVAASLPTPTASQSGSGLPSAVDPIQRRRGELQGIISDPTRQLGYQRFEETQLSQTDAARSRARGRMINAVDPIAVQREMEKYDRSTQQALANRQAQIQDQAQAELGLLARSESDAMAASESRRQQQQQFDAELALRQETAQREDVYRRERARAQDDQWLWNVVGGVLGAFAGPIGTAAGNYLSKAFGGERADKVDWDPTRFQW